MTRSISASIGSRLPNPIASTEPSSLRDRLTQIVIEWGVADDGLARRRDAVRLKWWRAEVHRFDLVGRNFRRGPPPGVSEEVAARAASANPYFFIRAGRSGSFPRTSRSLRTKGRAVRPRPAM